MREAMETSVIRWTQWASAEDSEGAASCCRELVTGLALVSGELNHHKLNDPRIR